MLKLSAIERKATNRDRYEVALSHVGPSKVRSEDVDIDAVFDQFPGLRAPETVRLKDKLGKANNVRPRVLLYLVEHMQRQ